MAVTRIFLRIEVTSAERQPAEIEPKKPAVVEGQIVDLNA